MKNAAIMKMPTVFAVMLCVMSEVQARDPYGILIKPIPDKTVVLSFDDGCLSDVNFVAPLLKKHGFNATFYITEAMGFKSRKDWYMTWQQIQSLQDMGFEIGNHTVHHWGLSAHTLETCIRTTEGMETLFRANKIPVPKTFCWPIYHVNDRFVPVLIEKGYWFARGGGERPYDPLKDNPLNVPSFTLHDRALAASPNRFVAAAEQARDGKIAVFCLHGVPDKEHPQVGLAPKTFEAMLTYLRENGYTVLSMRDMAQYIDCDKAARLLSDPQFLPWGGRSPAWGGVTQEEDRLYLCVTQMPADRQLTLPDMTTWIERAYLLADPQKTPLEVDRCDRGLSTVTVGPCSAETYGTSPVVVVAELKGSATATLLDFIIPGMPDASFSGDTIKVEVPLATDLKTLAPIYRTGSPQVTGRPVSGSVRDFTQAQTYDIQAADGSRRTYVVTVVPTRGVVGVSDPSFEKTVAFNGHEEVMLRGADADDSRPGFWHFSSVKTRGEVGVRYRGRVPPDGSPHNGFIAGEGSSISQRITLDRGRYRISFDLAKRCGYEPTAAPMHVFLDETLIFTAEKPPVNGDWGRVVSPVLNVTDGIHKLSFVLGQGGMDLIDNVSIKRQND